MKRQELLGKPDGLVHGAVDNAALAPDGPGSSTFMEENPAISTLINGGFNGKIIYKWAIFHGYVK